MNEKGTILVVDDDHVRLKVLILEFEDYYVETAGDGRKALDCLKIVSDLPNLILNGK